MPQRPIIIFLDNGEVRDIKDLNNQGTKSQGGLTVLPDPIATIHRTSNSECYVIRSGGVERKICYP